MAAFSLSKFKDAAISGAERLLCIASYIFAYIEVSTTFAAKAHLKSDSIAMKYFYVNYVAKLIDFYIRNVYAVFAVMIAIFIYASNGKLGGSKFARFNIIQALLLNILLSCVSALFRDGLPTAIRESAIGLMIGNSLYIGTVILILYSCVYIAFGRYPKMPILSVGAQMHVRRGRD